MIEEHYNTKWKEVIDNFPIGGNYRLDLRQECYDIIKERIPIGSKIFDFGCGLGIIDIQLKNEKNCCVYGADLSQVAIDYINKEIGVIHFCKTNQFFGWNYDFILAIHFVEHIINPVEWLFQALKFAPKVIFTIPNNFRCNGEHTYQQWKSWDDFYGLFKGFNLERIDSGRYSKKCRDDFRPPIFEVIR